MRKLTVLLILATIGIVGIAAGISKNTANASKTAARTTKQQPTKTTVDPAGTINGALTPEKISDHVAYSLLFDLIAGRQTEAEKNRIRSYIRQVGLGKQSCKNCSSTGVGDADIDTLIVAAEEYRQQISVLDAQAAAINIRSHTSRAPLSISQVAQLKQLESRREAIVNNIAASLADRLSVEGTAKLRQIVSERVKRNTKIFPD